MAINTYVVVCNVFNENLTPIFFKKKEDSPNY